MNSRWTTNPVTRNGLVVGTRPNTPGDLEILKILARYTLLTAPDIAALTGRSYKAVIQRLNKLKRKPNQFIKVCEAQLQHPRIYQWSPQAVHLAPAGVGKLLELGVEPKTPKPSSNFLHQLTENQTAASFEIGARDRLITFDQILGAPQTPAGATNSIPVRFTYKGKDYEYAITPDGTPFGIGYPDDTYRFCVFETDCASEPLTSSNRDRQAIETKFAAYLAVLEQGLYETVWGLPNLFILFTTTTKARLENMMALLGSMTADKRLLKCFGFQTFPTILSASPQPEKGWAVRSPWLQIGGHLNLAQP